MINGFKSWSCSNLLDRLTIRLDRRATDVHDSSFHNSICVPLAMQKKSKVDNIYSLPFHQHQFLDRIVITNLFVFGCHLQ